MVAFVEPVQARRSSVLQDYAAAMAMALSLRALVGLPRIAAARDASLIDLERDALGILAATGFPADFDPRLRVLPSARSIRRAALLVGVPNELTATVPLATAGAAYMQCEHNVPTPVDFDSPLRTCFASAYDAMTVDQQAIPENGTLKYRDCTGLHALLGGGANMTQAPEIGAASKCSEWRCDWI